MIKLVKYDRATTYITPDHAIATPEVMIEKYPAIQHFTYVAEISGNQMRSIHELSSMRAEFKIDNALTEDEAIAEIERIVNIPAPEPEPSTDERIAAAMEFQNLLSL